MPPEKKFLSDVTLQLPRNSAFLFRVRRKWIVKDQNMSLGSRSCELVLMDEKLFRFWSIFFLFPLMVSYAMTMNKSQGQSLENVGVFLRRPVFTHG
ncbi:unnamed protein product, partial [Cuscuta europaea]